MYLPNSIIFLYGRFASIDFIDKNKTGLHRAKNKKTKSGNIQVPPPATGLITRLFVLICLKFVLL